MSTQNEETKQKTALNFKQWTFGTSRNPDEVLNLLPDISIQNKEYQNFINYEQIDESFLNEQRKHAPTIEYLANLFDKTDINYMKLKEPEYIYGANNVEIESSKLPHLAEGILRGCVSKFPNLIGSSEINKPSSCPLDPEEFVKNILKPYEKEIGKGGEVIDIIEEDDMMEDGNDNEDLNDDEANISGSFNSMTVKTEEEIKQTYLNKLETFMKDVVKFESDMVENKEYSQEGLLYFDSDMELMTDDTLLKLQKHFSKLAKYDGFDFIEKDVLSRIFQLFHNNIKHCEFKTIYEINSNFKINHPNENLDQEIGRICSQVKYGMMASILCLNLAKKVNIYKYLYTENIMNSTLSFIKNHWAYSLLPSIEIIKENFSATKFQKLPKEFMQVLKNNIYELSNLASLITTFFQDFTEFIKESDLTLGVVITLGYICISALFADINTTYKVNIFSKGSGNLFKSQFNKILQIIFTNYPDQRTWILEEILASLVKLHLDKRTSKEYRLADGKLLHTATVIILQLVQCSFENCISKSIMESKDYQDFAVDQFSPKSLVFQSIVDKLQTSWKTSLDESNKIIGFTLKYIFSRATKGKKQNEVEYRILLDNILEDSLTILNLPEWPSAETLLRVMTTILIGFIEDSDTDLQLKNLSIEYLGYIAARIKKYNVQSLESDYIKACEDASMFYDPEVITSLTQLPEQISVELPLPLVETFWKSEDKLLMYLKALSTEDFVNEGARKFHLCELGVTLIKAHFVSLDKKSDKKNGRKMTNTRVDDLIKSSLAKVIYLSCNNTTIDSLKVSEYLETQNREVVYIISEAIAFSKPLYRSFDFILARILYCLDMNALSYRNKAIKALSQVVSNYPEIINLSNIRSSVVLRIQDSSASVRESAVELIGRYINLKPEAAQQYYKLISDRVLDIGTGVRKRAIRILRDLYPKTKERDLMIDIYCKLLSRTCDDEVHVRDLATKSLQDIWFMPLEKHYIPLDYDPLISNEHKTKFENVSILGQKELMERVMIIIDVVKSICVSLETDQLIVDFISKSLEKPKDLRSEASKKWGFNLAMSKLIVGCLFHRLVEVYGSEDKGNISNILKCIYTFCSSNGLLMSSNHISTLEPFLICSFEPLDQMNMYYVLKIYNQVFPFLNYSNPKLLNSMENTLMSSLPKLSPTVLLEAVPCMCIIEEIIGSANTKVSQVYKSCFELLKKEQFNFEEYGAISAEKNTMRLLLITGLIAQNIDKKKVLKSTPRSFINSKELLNEVYNIISYFLRPEMRMLIRLSALESLGYLMLEYQEYFIKESTFQFFSDIFDSESMDFKIKLLDLLFLYLSQESPTVTDLLKKAENDKPTTFEDLVGNTEEMGRSSIISSVMQYCLDHTLNCLLSNCFDLQTKALRVIRLILEQGHVHPLKCVPAIIAMMTVENQTIKKTAYYIYNRLTSKFPSFIHSRNPEALKVVYDYQKSISPSENLYGFRKINNEQPTSLLHEFYKHLRSSRQRRNELLHCIMKSFDYDFKDNSVKVDARYHKFMAENLAFFEYKTLEEAIYLISLINQVISTTGANVIHFIDNENERDENSIDEDTLIKLADSMSILIVLKVNLQMQYGISSSKLITYRIEDSKMYKDRPLTLFTGGFDPTGDWIHFHFSTDEGTDALNRAGDKFKSLLSRDSTSLLEYDDDAYSTDKPNLSKHKSKTKANIMKATTSKTAVKYIDSTDDDDWSAYSDEEEGSDDEYIPNFPIKGLRK